MNRQIIGELGAYSAGILSAAASRGMLTSATASTMLNGLIEIFNETAEAKVKFEPAPDEKNPQIQDLANHRNASG